MADPSPTCPACGSPASGNFCSACGASLVARACTGCRADLSAQARFCHRCGRPVGAGAPPRSAAPALPARERNAWAIAGTLCVLLLGIIVYTVFRGASAPAAPDMANAGSANGQPAGGAAGGSPPDISQMTPRERFDRLFNRIMQAAQQNDTAQVERFSPMALGAYGQLDSIDTDARYHAAVLRLQLGDFPGALALADTIEAKDPGHLFGYLIRGTAAGYNGDSPALQRAGRDFLAHYNAEMKAGRPEYQEHEPAIGEFKRQAEAAAKPAK